MINSNSGAVSIEGKAVNFYTQYRLFDKKWRLQESKIVFETHFEERLDKKFKIDATISMRYVSFENLPLLKSNIFPAEILNSTNNFSPSRSVSSEYWTPYSYLKSTNEALKLASILKATSSRSFGTLTSYFVLSYYGPHFEDNKFQLYAGSLL